MVEIPNNVNSMVSLPSDMRRLFDDFLKNVNIRLPRKQCPGSPRAAIPAFSPHVLVGEFPKPFLTQLRCGCAFL